MQDKALVSIIMNVHNGEQYIRESIESALAQTYRNIELIVWDNKSTDDTAKIVQSFQDERIKYHYSEIFIPLGEARNLALERCNGDFVSFLDSDDLIVPGKIEEQMPVFDDEKVGIVICDSLFFNANGKSEQLYLKQRPPQGAVFSEMLSDYFVSLETVIIRRKALKELDDYFDDRFSMIEEYDFFVRIAYRWKVGYVDKVLAKCRIHADSYSQKHAGLFPIERRMMLVKFKSLIPDFATDYAVEIEAVEKRCDWETAQVAWSQGKNAQARKLISKYIRDERKYLFAYLLSWFPYAIFIAFKKMNGAVLP